MDASSCLAKIDVVLGKDADAVDIGLGCLDKSRCCFIGEERLMNFPVSMELDRRQVASCAWQLILAAKN